MQDILYHCCFCITIVGLKKLLGLLYKVWFIQLFSRAAVPIVCCYWCSCCSILGEVAIGIIVKATISSSFQCTKEFAGHCWHLWPFVYHIILLFRLASWVTNINFSMLAIDFIICPFSSPLKTVLCCSSCCSKAWGLWLTALINISELLIHCCNLALRCTIFGPQLV